METHQNLPSLAFINGHPSSPPMTPGSRSQTRFPPQTSHTSPIYKRMGLSKLAQSPPLEFIEPIGRGPHFNFTRPQSTEPSSRPSTASGQPCTTTSQDSEDDSESDEASSYEEEQPARRVEKGDFVLEELDSDPGYDSDIEVVRPDHYEDAKSEKSSSSLEENGFMDKFKDLQCSSEDSTDEEERQRIYRRKKKRWSAGIFKRSYSQSIEGDSSYSDNDPVDDVDPTARRLRRRVRGPGDRSSLIFVDDRDAANANNIVEVEEEDDLEIMHSKGPPSIPSDDGFTLDELPFFHMVDESMDTDSDSTDSSSSSV